MWEEGIWKLDRVSRSRRAVLEFTGKEGKFFDPEGLDGSKRH